MENLAPTSPTTPLCRAGHPLATPGGYCPTCATCQLCKRPLTATEYHWTLEHTPESQDPAFRHPGCFSEVERLTLATEEVSIPRALFDKLNACRLLLEPLEDRNVKTNEQDADICMHRWIHESAKTKSYEEHSKYLVLVLIRMESACATLSLATNKQRRVIEQELSEKDKQAHLEARTAAKAHRDLAPTTHKKVDKRKLTKEEKAVAALVALGLSEADARQSIQRTSKVQVN
jgi:hypothetical protein